MEVSKNIRAIRESKGLTQVDVATKLGTERSNYARLENRDENLTIKQLKDIAGALGTTIYDILGDTNTGKSEGQSDKLQLVQERIKDLEEILADKREHLKIYKYTVSWVRSLFVNQFIICALSNAQRIEMEIPDMESAEVLTLDLLSQYTEKELNQLGESMLSYEAPDYLLNYFIASSGFVTEPWFIRAYKRAERRAGNKINYAVKRNWVDYVFNLDDL